MNSTTAVAGIRRCQAEKKHCKLFCQYLLLVVFFAQERIVVVVVGSGGVAVSQACSSSDDVSYPSGRSHVVWDV